MKIVFFQWGPHHQAAWEYLFSQLELKGFNPINHSGQENGKKIADDADIVFIASDRDRPIKNPKTKTYFIGHGMGLESWDPGMNNDDRVFLAGKKPWSPPPEVTNWRIVGWSKSDVLWHPEKEKVEYVNNFMTKFPYDTSILFVPPQDRNDLPHLDFIVEYADQHKYNLIIPFRKRSQAYNIEEGIARYQKYKNVQCPEILNLYYFKPYIKIVAIMGLSSVGREFYPTGLPTLHAGFGFEESHFSYPIERDFPKFLEEALVDPKKYLQPPNIIKDFHEIFDGEATGRIIAEIEKM